MASLIKKPSGKYMVKFYRDNRPVHVMLPTGNKKQAETICNMIERRIVQLKTGEPDRLLDNWISELSEDMRSRLVRCGLLKETPRSKTFAEVSEEYLAAKKTTWKKITVKGRTSEHKKLIEFFGDSTIESITKKDATAYLNWLVVYLGRAPISVNKMIKWAAAVYDFAVENEYLSKANPFRRVGVPNKVQREKAYISVEYTEQLIAVAPDLTWKTMIALLRYGGLRPGEAIAAEWSGVDWKNNLFTFRSPKTERHEGKEQRTIPLFPRLKAALETAYKAAKKDDKYILTGRRWDSKRRDADLGKTGSISELNYFAKKLKQPNPGSLPTNMRGSCSTDLKQSFPEFVVDSWLGHSANIAHKHYDVVTRKNIELATEIDVFSEDND